MAPSGGGRDGTSLGLGLRAVVGCGLGIAGNLEQICCRYDPAEKVEGLQVTLVPSSRLRAGNQVAAFHGLGS